MSPSLNESVKVERVNAATPRQRGAVLLFLIPMFAILAPLLGGMTVAIDATAGERERGSLEPLLANPVPTAAFAVGKWLAAWASATVVAAVTLAGFVARRGPVRGEEAPGAPAVRACRSSLRFVAIVVPLAAFTSAAQMLISTYGRSYREAQTYVSYLADGRLLRPAGGDVQRRARGRRGRRRCRCWASSWRCSACCAATGCPPADALVPAAVALALAIAAVAAVARLLRDERIVFGRS